MLLGRSSNDGDLYQESSALTQVPRQNSVRDRQRISAKCEAHESARLPSVYAGPKERRSKWDPKAREGLFVGYEEVLKAYRIYDIEADRVVISRDVSFNESAFTFSPTLPQESVDDTALDFDSMSISDDPHTMQFKHTRKRKDRSNSQEQVFQRTIPARHGAGLEEASAPEDIESRRAK